MNKKYSLVFLTFFCFVAFGFGQTTLWSEDFTIGTYSIPVGGEGNDGASDYFQKTDGSNIGISYSGNTGIFFAAQDVDDGGWAGSQNPSRLLWTGVNISGYSSLQFSGEFASDTNDKIDDQDYASVQYRIDGGAWTNLLSFENDGAQYNSMFGEDTDFDGDSDGTDLTGNFLLFTKNIIGSGSVLDIRITVAVNSGGEDFAFDEFEITGFGGTPTYSVVYDGNGNTGGTVPTDGNVYNSSDIVTVLGNTGSLINTCNTFNGWNTAADGTGSSYTGGSTFNITANTTLFAQWSPTGNTVTFNSNGGSGTMPDQINCVPATLDSNTFTNTGFTFNSWNTAADGSGTTYADDAVYNFSADITLYAQWDVFVGPCASESFINSNATTSYSNGSFLGDNGVTWSYVASRDENGDANGSGINGNALMLRRSSDNSRVTSSSVSGGIGDFSVKLYKGFTGSGNRQVELFVNGVSQGNSTPFDDFNEHIFIINDINISGNVIVEIRNSTGNQVIIDDIEWTCFSCIGTPDDVTNFTTTQGCGAVGLTWDTPACAEEVLIVARDGSAVTATPTGDGSAYIADTVFGNGTDIGVSEFVVFKGNATTETITSLTNGNNYHFTAFSRVGSNWSTGESTSIVYSGSAANVTTFTTYNNCGDISLNWTLPTCYDEVLVVARNGSTVTASPSGDGSAYTANANFGTGGSGANLPANEYAVYQGTGTTETITGLTEGQTYNFDIFVRVGTEWSSGVTSSATAISSGGSGPTTFNPGDLVFIGFDSYIGGANDKYSILNLVDIGPNTEFIMANLLYEWNDAANVSSGKWYDCDNQFDVDPPYALIQYTGCSDIPKGSVICIETNGAGSISYITINGITATSDFTIDATNYTAGNISTSNPDAMWLMQGTFSAVQTEADGSDNGTSLDRFRTFNGTVFGGLQTKGYFQEASDSGDNGGSRISRIHPDIECLYLETGPTSNSRFFGFYYGTTTGSQYQLLSNITDIANYWDIQSGGSGGIQDSDNISFTCSDSFTITSNDAIAGQWMGNLSTDWFDCHNWQNFTVPDSGVDVNINSTSIRNCDVDSTSPYAPKYNYIADCNNINLTNRRLIIDSNNDVLNVAGDLEIDNSGVLDMNDGNNGTDDGLINLNGNWINNVNINAFDEGNGTVAFVGSSTQSILFPPPLPPTDTEEFYNVILDNNFNTGISNNLHANGNLTINSGRTLTVPDGNYVYVNLGVTNNGIFNIENNGSLVQGSDTDVNIGDISMERIANIRRLDYVYWSSPVEGFNVNNIYTSNTPTNRIYRWNPTITNPNGGQGNWVSANGETMLKGVGYIVRGPDSFTTSNANITATFNNGKPFNGYIPINVYNGADSGSDDDDWNLIGNPYPSSINAITFLTNSTNASSLEGFVNIWTHGSLPSTATADPFYDDFGSNYTESDYITYNSTGSSTPSGFNGFIASGQSFMVNTVNGVNQTYTVEFRNNMRDKSNDNSQFFRTINDPRSEEKHRIWLDLVSDNQSTSRILLGYVEGATDGRDRMYDAITDNQAFYSLIENKAFVIQGRGLPFNDSDIIPLGFKSISQGNYIIAIADLDGMFDQNNQTIYLKDHLLGITHNLRSDPYSFVTEEGVFDNRFEIVFRASALSVDDLNFASNNISIIELDNDYVKFKVHSNNLSIKNIKIIDLTGRVVYNLNGQNSSETFNLSNLGSSTYVAKITLSNNQVVHKKAIKK